MSSNNYFCNAGAILNFGDAQDHNIGRVNYDNSDNHMSFFTNNSERLSFHINWSGYSWAHCCNSSGATNNLVLI